MLFIQDMKVPTVPSLSASNHLCDRRRSRAARELLRNHLIHAWQETHRLLTSSSSSSSSKVSKHPNDLQNQYNVDVTEWNLWQLLDATIVRSDDSNNNDPQHHHPPSCPILPQYDIYKEHEASYSVWDMSSTLVPIRFRNSAIPGILHHSRTQRKPAHKQQQPLQNQYPFIYHCDVCQKNFTSQYYLDQHLISQHPMTIFSEQICPADTYCSFLSPFLCEEYMIQHEPYYGPGHVPSHERTVTHFKCDDQQLHTATQKCHEIVALCFDENTIRDGDSNSNNIFGELLSTNMCSTIPHHCPSRLDVMMNTMTGSIFHHNYFSWEYWKSTTIYDHHHHHTTTTTWVALLMVLLMFLLIFGHYLFQLCFAIRQRHHQQQQERRFNSKLNNINPPSNRISQSHRTLERIVLQAPTTYIVPTKTKAKLT